MTTDRITAPRSTDTASTTEHRISYLRRRIKNHLGADLRQIAKASATRKLPATLLITLATAQIYTACPIQGTDEQILKSVQTLITQTAQDEDRAAQTLQRITELSARLHKYASRRATEAVTADDLYQIAILEILKSAKPTDNDTYLLRLADWRMKDAVNHEAKSYTVRVDNTPEPVEDEELETGIEALVDQSLTPEEVLIRSELERKVSSLLPELSDQHRKIVISLASGDSQHDIAGQLGVSQTMVSRHVKTIRSIFEQRGLTPALVLA